MSTFTKYPNSAKWIIGILLVMNILCLAALWFGRPPGKQHQRAHHKLVHQVKKELNLNEQQTLDLDAMVKRQKDEQGVVKDQIRELKRELRIIVSSDPADPAKIQKVAQEIGAKSIEIELNVVRHLEEMKNICTPDQLKKLQAIIAKPEKHGKKKK